MPASTTIRPNQSTAGPHSHRRKLRTSLVAALAIGLLTVAGSAACAADGSSAPSWSPASANGRWSTGDCRVRYYDYSISIDGREATFRDQSGAVDVERITEIRSDGFSAVTVSASSSSAIGTRWSYTFSGNQVRIVELTSGRRLVQTRCSPAVAIAPARDAAANRAAASPEALTALAAQLGAFAGRWSDTSCARRWNDWSINGLEITFHDQSGGTDMERVFDLQPGAFLTQSVIVSRGAQPSIWRYQPVSPDALRVQDLSTGATFLLGRCSSPPPSPTAQPSPVQLSRSRVPRHSRRFCRHRRSRCPSRLHSAAPPWRRVPWPRAAARRIC